MTPKELSIVLGVSIQAIHQRAKTEGWKHVVKNARGDKDFDERSLPADVRAALVEASARAIAPVVAGDPIYIDRGAGVPAVQSLPQGPAFADPKALAKSDLLRLYLRAVGQARRGSKEKARRNFMAVYNSGLGYPKLFEQLGKLSWQCIEGWKYKGGLDDWCKLIDTRGKAMRGQRSISNEQAGIVIACCRSHMKIEAEIIRHAREIMHARGIENGLSDDTYRRFIQDWRSTHFDEWVWWREGDKGLNDKCLPYIVRDYDRIEVGDVVTADGHVLNFLILNPWTGKPKRMMLIVWYDMKSSYPCGWELMPTENVQAIHSALRRAILTLGKIPKVAILDNGKAFRAKIFTDEIDLTNCGIQGTYSLLGMQTNFAQSYHGQTKTVERLFGTAGELERMSPSYVGSCIADKPPHMRRGEKLHRRIHELATGGAVPTLVEAHMAIAKWFDTYANREQQNGHLAGIKPIDVFMAGRGPGVDPDALRILMMAEAVRTIRRNGIWWAGNWYYSPDLYGRKHRAKFLYDWLDKDRVYVYDETGHEFLCEAKRINGINPASTTLGNDADREALTEALEMKGALRKDTVRLARDFAESVVIPETRKRLAEITEISEGQKVKRLPGPKPGELTEEEAARIMAEAEQVRADTEAMNDAAEAPPEPEAEYVPVCEDDSVGVWKKLESKNDGDRYEEILVATIRGWLVPKRWQAFMTYYEATDEFSRRADFWEEFKIKIAMAYSQ